MRVTTTENIPGYRITEGKGHVFGLGPPPRDPGPWDAADERFVDPASGKVTTVSPNRRTDERRYDADV